MNERDLLMQIYRTCSDKNQWTSDKSYDKGWREAYESIVEMIDKWVEDRKKKEVAAKQMKLKKLKEQLRDLYTELENALDAGNTWSAQEVQEEIERLRTTIEASYKSLKKKPIGRKLRIEF